jgi:hypothetical protein
MDNSDGLSEWLGGLQEEMGTDPLAYTVMMYLMVLTIRRTIPEEELDKLLPMILRKMKQNLAKSFRTQGQECFLAEGMEPIDNEEFSVDLDKTVKESEERLRKMLGIE